MSALQLPAEMMDGAVIMSSVSTGVTSLDGKPVAMAVEYARSGIEPALGAAFSATGISPEEGRNGSKLLRVVGGTEHQEVAALNFGEKLGNQQAMDSAQVGAPVTGMAPGMIGPDGQSR